MKKRWIPFILMLIATAFITGLRMGHASEADRHHTLSQDENHRHNTAIAVVNADVGTIINGSRYNYSAAIISTLPHEFELVSPAMAQTGFANGAYGAIVTFPSNVSHQILSFNAHQPQRIQLDFQINPSLPEKEFLEIYITITELQMALNTTLASTYISSIFRQFHEGQDQVEGVFRNTLVDLMALETLTLADFTATLTLDEVPRIPLNPRELDTVFYLEQVQSFAEEVSSWYRNSYAMATDQYLWMREGLFALTANFPQQEDDWMEMLYLWTSYSVKYGELLEEYSRYVRAHEEDLAAWHEENVTWHHSLEDYQQQVEDWHQDSNFWFDGAASWHTEYLGFLGEAQEFYEELRDFRLELEGNIDPLKDDISAWKDQLTEYEDRLNQRLNDLMDMAAQYNQKADLFNFFAQDLLGWYDFLDEYKIDLISWQYEIEENLQEVNTWVDSLASITNQIQQTINTIEQEVAALPPMPDAVVFALPPAYNPGAITRPPSPPVLQPQNTISGWNPPSVNTTPITIPSVPSQPPGPPPMNIPANSGDITLYSAALHVWHLALEGWHTSLSTWYGNLPPLSDIENAINEVNTRQAAINYAVTQTSARQSQLQTFYQNIITASQPLYDSYHAIITWHNRLENTHTHLTSWNGQLSAYSTNMIAWRTNMNNFITRLNTQAGNLPTVPGHMTWEHVELPPDIIPPILMLIDPLDIIELPDWEDTLSAPPAYDGARIIDAFNIPFPLDGNAIEPMYLERPEAFTDYTIPETVDYHDWLMAIQPLNPLVGPPPRPDDFWFSLNFMHDQLSSFNVGDFLSYDIQRMVDQSVLAYDIFLQSLRDELSFLFQDNIWLMYDIHAEYEDFLFGVRHNALDANFHEQETLRTSIEAFATARETTHDDNRQRLATFAAMMPESRAATGVSQELIDFVVMPLYFTPLSLRESAPIPFEPVGHMADETFQRYQMIMLAALGGVFLGTAISSIVSYVNKKKRDDAEARGYV